MLRVPVSFFAMVVGLAGLGNCWRVAVDVWGVPSPIGEAILLLSVMVWLILLLAYAGKWIFARANALAEFRDPIQCCFIGLVPIGALFASLAIQPYSRGLAIVLFIASATSQFLFGVYRSGAMWLGDRDPAKTTPVMYLPVVAGSFVTTIAAGSLGFPDWGRVFFGAGMFSWLAIESVILRRLYEVDTLATTLRPTLGIQLAPPAVGCIAYLALTTGLPDLFAEMLLGYGLLQALVLLRLFPWIRQQPLAPSYWAFTLGFSALSLAVEQFLKRGATGPVEYLAIPLFVLANLVIGGMVAGTLWLMLRGRLLPAVPVLVPERKV